MLAEPDTRVTTLGNDQRCANAGVSPYCGFGFIYANDIGGAIVRGSGLDWGNGAGVFSSPLWFRDFDSDWNIGFRCAYEP
jgi:hypothetical protein